MSTRPSFYIKLSPPPFFTISCLCCRGKITLGRFYCPCAVSFVVEIITFFLQSVTLFFYSTDVTLFPRHCFFSLITFYDVFFSVSSHVIFFFFFWSFFSSSTFCLRFLSNELFLAQFFFSTPTLFFQYFSSSNLFFFFMSTSLFFISYFFYSSSVLFDFFFYCNSFFHKHFRSLSLYLKSIIHS